MGWLSRRRHHGFRRGGRCCAETLREVAEELDAFEAAEDLEPGLAVCMILTRADSLDTNPPPLVRSFWAGYTEGVDDAWHEEHTGS